MEDDCMDDGLPKGMPPMDGDEPEFEPEMPDDEEAGGGANGEAVAQVMALAAQVAELAERTDMMMGNLAQMGGDIRVLYDGVIAMARDLGVRIGEVHDTTEGVQHLDRHVRAILQMTSSILSVVERTEQRTNRFFDEMEDQMASVRKRQEEKEAAASASKPKVDTSQFAVGKKKTA